MNLSPLVQINESLVFGVIIAIWIVYRVIRNLATRKIDLLREIVLNLAFLYGCFVIYVTFFPMVIVLYAFDPYDSNLIPLVKTIQMIRYGSILTVVRNLIGNLLLLAPLGFLLPIYMPGFRQGWRVMLIGFLVSFSIEISQLFLAVRIFDVDDLIINTLGVLIGFLLFLLLDQIPALTKLLARFYQPERQGQKMALLAYSLVTLLAFLSIYTYQIVRQTETEAAIIKNLPSAQQTLLGTPKFGEYLFAILQSDQGGKSYTLYRQVFFNRYTLFQWGDLQMDENSYSVSGMSTGHRMNYFVIARSQKTAAAMTADGLRYPLAKVGDLYFSYAGLPLERSARPFLARFLDSQGNDLALSQPQ